MRERFATGHLHPGGLCWRIRAKRDGRVLRCLRPVHSYAEPHRDAELQTSWYEQQEDDAIRDIREPFRPSREAAPLMRIARADGGLR